MDGLDEIPWCQLSHAYGTAEDVPVLLRELQTASPKLKGEEHPIWHLFGNIWHQGTVYEATSYAVPFLIRLARDPQTPDRISVLNLLEAIARGTSYHAVHEGILKYLDGSRFDQAECDRKKTLELEWVSKAHAAVLAGFEIFVEITRDESDVRYAAAHVLVSLLVRRAEIVAVLQGLLDTETRPLFRAGTLLLWSALDDPSAELLDHLHRAGQQSEVVLRRAAALGSARLRDSHSLAIPSELIAESLLDDDRVSHFDGFPFDALAWSWDWYLTEAARADGDAIAARLMALIEAGQGTADGVSNLLELAFPRGDESHQFVSQSELSPFQFRAVKALVVAIDKYQLNHHCYLPDWGLPDSMRNLRNLAAGRDFHRVDLKLPIIGDPNEPRVPLFLRDLQTGQRIHHRHFGLGVITEVRMDERGVGLQVSFDEEGEKTLGYSCPSSAIMRGVLRVSGWCADKFNRVRDVITQFLR